MRAVLGRLTRLAGLTAVQARAGRPVLHVVPAGGPCVLRGPTAGWGGLESNTWPVGSGRAYLVGHWGLASTYRYSPISAVLSALTVLGEGPALRTHGLVPSPWFPLTLFFSPPSFQPQEPSQPAPPWPPTSRSRASESSVLKETCFPAPQRMRWLIASVRTVGWVQASLFCLRRSLEASKSC